MLMLMLPADADADAYAPSVVQPLMLMLPFLAASRRVPFLRNRRATCGTTVGRGWSRRSGGGPATAVTTLCAARQRRGGASLRTAASHTSSEHTDPRHATSGRNLQHEELTHTTTPKEIDR